jgi:hypothetical protein
MGYEVKMYIIEKSDQKSHRSGLYWASVIGMVDLCKVGHHGKVSDLIKKQDAEVYFYAEDGNTEVTVDRYDEPLRVLDPGVVLAAMMHDHAQDPYRRYAVAIPMLRDPYRRYAVAIPMLREAIDAFSKDRLKVLFYGH